VRFNYTFSAPRISFSRGQNKTLYVTGPPYVTAIPVLAV
jgi:hypothetical protein